jgi:hypothetical protein
MVVTQVTGSIMANAKWRMINSKWHITKGKWRVSDRLSLEFHHLNVA